MSRRVRTALASAAALSALSSPALADCCGFLNPGLLYTYTGGRNPGHGVGGEVSFMHFHERPGDGGFGLGALVQAEQRDIGNREHHPRVAIAGQYGHVLGVEAGLAWRGESRSYSPTYGAHLGLFGSIAMTSIALRATVPFAEPDVDGKRSHGWDLGLALTLKIPVRLYGDDPIGPLFGSGRPLEVGGQQLLPGVDAARPAVRRSPLGEQWLTDGRMEHASVATFLRLAAELAQLGAPPALVDDAVTAAHEEVDHATRCYRLAARELGTVLYPRPLPPAALRPRTVGLETLARESWRDGILGEGYAAAIAERARHRATDADVFETLSVIARDEASHAALAWRVLRWCLEIGDRRLRGGLQRPAATAAPHTSTEPTPRAWLESGRVASTDSSALMRTTRREALAAL